jgi:rhomboid protease GluP
MDKTHAGEPPAGPWEAFVLAMLAPLGACPGIHLAPRIPPERLNNALRTYLPLQDDELLLALFDGGVDRLQGCSALTTRRVYWVSEQRDDVAGESTRKGPAAVPRWLKGNSARKSKPVCLSASYAALAPAIVPEMGKDRLVHLDLGVAHPLVLGTSNLRVGQLLARFLEIVGAAARLGAEPSLSAVDADLASRVTRVLPAVASVTQQARRMTHELIQFRRTLFAGTPHVFVTPLLALSCVAVFTAMVCSGVPAINPESSALLQWGANQGVRVLVRREYWRLLTSVFVHGGLLHLAVNLWCLMTIGPFVERLYGNRAYLAIFLAAGIGGALASAVRHAKVSVGASGAIFGVLGALLSFLIIHRRSIPSSVLKPLRANTVGFVAFNTILGVFVPIIDQSAHLGGLVTGLLSGLLLSRRWPVIPKRCATDRARHP